MRNKIVLRGLAATVMMGYLFLGDATAQPQTPQDDTDYANEFCDDDGCSYALKALVYDYSGNSHVISCGEYNEDAAIAGGITNCSCTYVDYYIAYADDPEFGAPIWNSFNQWEMSWSLYYADYTNALCAGNPCSGNGTNQTVYTDVYFGDSDTCYYTPN